MTGKLPELTGSCGFSFGSLSATVCSAVPRPLGQVEVGLVGSGRGWVGWVWVGLGQLGVANRLLDPPNSPTHIEHESHTVAVLCARRKMQAAVLRRPRLHLRVLDRALLLEVALVALSWGVVAACGVVRSRSLYAPLDRTKRLLTASAISTSGEPLLCSSRIHFLALSNESGFVMS